MNCWRAIATYQFTLIPIAFLRTVSAPVQDTAFPSAWLPELLQYAEPPVKAAAGPKSPEPRYTLEALALSNAANCSADAWGAAANARNAIHRVRAIVRAPKVAEYTGAMRLHCRAVNARRLAFDTKRSHQERGTQRRDENHAKPD
jgi:hypothetical protein